MPESEARVSTLELFFDLVFVFAITQITGAVSHDSTAVGLARGVLLFAVLWWAWGAYAWLTNTVDTGETAPRLVLLAAMAATLVTALAVPTAWGDGGVAFALGYLVVMVLHAALFALAGDRPEATRRAILRLAPSNLGAAVLLVGAGLSDGATQTALWVAAVVVSYAGPYVTGVAGFTVHPGHFVERHGLIVIIALGESIVAIGAGGEDIVVDWALAGTALAVMTLVAGLWWDYFTDDAAAGERALLAAQGHERARLARDVYSYLHVPLVLGIVFAAVGIHEVLAHSDAPLDPVFASAYAGGVALYFAGLAGIRLRRGDPPGMLCIAAVVASLAMIPVGAEVDAIVTTIVLAVVSLGVALSRAGRTGSATAADVPSGRPA
ncbi:MAG TPA: low temperature requirement protein A [Acidimicrobiales bacterium]|nr:low temperature requirement protein A [Acidimicrobiales bacterium]